MRRYRAIVSLLIAGVTLSLLAFAFVRGREIKRIQGEFEDRARPLSTTLIRSLETKLETLSSVRALFSSVDEVDRTQFRTFVQHMLARHRDVRAIEWAPRVIRSERLSYEERAHEDGYPQFEITELNAAGAPMRAGDRAEYFPIYYVEPFDGNESAFGFDLKSELARGAALDAAIVTNGPSLSQRIKLLQETGEQFGTVIYLPVYRNGAQSETVEQRRRGLAGFAVVVLRIGDWVESSLLGMDREGIALHLKDMSAPDELSTLYAQKIAPGDKTLDRLSSLQLAIPYEIANRRWSMRLYATPEYRAAGPLWPAWGVLFSGLLLTGLLAFYVRSLSGRAARVEQLVAARTSELSHSNEALATQIAERERSEAIQEKLRSTVIELSTPVLPIFDGVLVAPVIGLVDTQRASQLLEAVLEGIHRYRTRVVLLDITGVPVMDTAVAATILQVTAASRLLGAEAVLVGTKPEIAQTLVRLEIDLHGLVSMPDLQAGLRYAFARCRVRLEPLD